MFSMSHDLEDPKKIKKLREKGKSFFRAIIDPASIDTLENIIRRRKKAGAKIEAATLRESLELCKDIQSKLASFSPEQREIVLGMLDAVSEEVFLSSCMYRVYDLDYQQEIMESQFIFSS